MLLLSPKFFLFLDVRLIWLKTILSRSCVCHTHIAECFIIYVIFDSDDSSMMEVRRMCYSYS